VGSLERLEACGRDRAGRGRARGRGRDCARASAAAGVAERAQLGRAVACLGCPFWKQVRVCLVSRRAHAPRSSLWPRGVARAASPNSSRRHLFSTTRCWVLCRHVCTASSGPRAARPARACACPRRRQCCPRASLFPIPSAGLRDERLMCPHFSPIAATCSVAPRAAVSRRTPCTRTCAAQCRSIAGASATAPSCSSRACPFPCTARVRTDRVARTATSPSSPSPCASPPRSSRSSRGASARRRRLRPLSTSCREAH